LHQFVLVGGASILIGRIFACDEESQFATSIGRSPANARFLGAAIAGFERRKHSMPFRFERGTASKWLQRHGWAGTVRCE